MFTQCGEVRPWHALGRCRVLLVLFERGRHFGPRRNARLVTVVIFSSRFAALGAGSTSWLGMLIMMLFVGRAASHKQFISIRVFRLSYSAVIAAITWCDDEPLAR